MKHDIIIAGHGGQGVVLAGNLLSHIAMEYGKEVTAMVSYGVEMRGGTANSSVIISDENIGSPVITNPDILVVMNQPSFEKYSKNLKKGSLILVNSDDVKAVIEGIKTIEIPAKTIAEDVGEKRSLNMVMIGSYLVKFFMDFKLTGPQNKALERILKFLLPRADEKIIKSNIDAINRGYELCMSKE